MILASHATVRRAGYDAEHRTVLLPSDATRYELAHERAHEWQQRCRTRAWIANERLAHVPYLARLSRLWVEHEAAALALTVLRELGLCDPATEREARAGLWSYWRALLW